MTDQILFSHKPAPWVRAMALIALVFGGMTLFASSNVLFGPQSARDQAGDIVPFVLWFNFAAGFAYIAAAVGIWMGRSWAFGLSALIALSTGLIAAAFAIYVITGAEYEMRTVGALILRTGVWAVIAYLLFRARR